jgi:hypothetical protein
MPHKGVVFHAGTAERAGGVSKIDSDVFWGVRPARFLGGRPEIGWSLGDGRMVVLGFTNPLLSRLLAEMGFSTWRGVCQNEMRRDEIHTVGGLHDSGLGRAERERVE